MRMLSSCGVSSPMVWPVSLSRRTIISRGSFGGRGDSGPFCLKSGRFGLAVARALEQGLLHVLDDQVDFLAGDGEVRGEAQRVGAAVDHADAVLAHVLLGRLVVVALERRVELAGEQ